MQTHAHSVSITRLINSTANELYAAWTEPEVLVRWFGQVLEADVRVGGRYRYEIRERDGTTNTFAGEYAVLDQGHRIVQTFSNVNTPPGTLTDEELEINLAPQGSLTKLTLTRRWNGRAPTDQDRAAITAAWTKRLDMLCAGVELATTQDS